MGPSGPQVPLQLVSQKETSVTISYLYTTQKDGVKARAL